MIVWFCLLIFVVLSDNCPPDLVLAVPFDREENCGSNMPLAKGCDGFLVRDESGKTVLQQPVNGPLVDGLHTAAPFQFPNNSAGFSCCAWLWFPLATDFDVDYYEYYDRIVELAVGSDNDEVFFGFSVFEGRLRLRVKDERSGRTLLFLSYDPALSTGRWQYVCATISFVPNALADFWVDGTQIAVGPPTLAAYFPVNAWFEDGVRWPTPPVPLYMAASVISHVSEEFRMRYTFKGRMRSLVVYSKSLNASEIASLMSLPDCADSLSLPGGVSASSSSSSPSSSSLILSQFSSSSFENNNENISGGGELIVIIVVLGILLVVVGVCFLTTLLLKSKRTSHPIESSLQYTKGSDQRHHHSTRSRSNSNDRSGSRSRSHSRSHSHSGSRSRSRQPSVSSSARRQNQDAVSNHPPLSPPFSSEYGQLVLKDDYVYAASYESIPDNNTKHYDSTSDPIL